PFHLLVTRTLPLDIFFYRRPLLLNPRSNNCMPLSTAVDLPLLLLPSLPPDSCVLLSLCHTGVPLPHSLPFPLTSINSIVVHIFINTPIQLLYNSFIFMCHYLMCVCVFLFNHCVSLC